MATLTGVLLGLLLFGWGKHLFGEAAGWIALFLFAFDPNFVANAIPTLDLPLAFTVTLAVYCLWRYLQRPTVLTLILTGLALGFALATKFLGVMLLPSFFFVLLVYRTPPVSLVPRYSLNASSP
jgi:4-amino-4-deoxy-L-arabinose transferase-like glycosyltransferase